MSETTVANVKIASKIFAGPVEMRTVLSKSTVCTDLELRPDMFLKERCVIVPIFTIA
jgi:hypothetical protein